MSRAIKMGGAGGGSGSDDVTAAKAQLLENYTAITKDSDDEPGAGTMKHLTNRATITHETANATKVLVGDAAYMVKNSDGVQRAEIRYNGSDGYVTPNTLFAIPAGTMATAGGMTAAKVLAGQSAFGISGTATNDATATASQMLAGATSYVKGAKVTGNIASKGAATYTPGTSAQTIAAGQYLSGAQTISAVANLSAGNIKKGVVVGGVTGTWEGWIKETYYLFNNGTNSGSWKQMYNYYFNIGSTLHFSTNTGNSNYKGIYCQLPLDITGYKTICINFAGSPSSTLYVALKSIEPTIGSSWSTHNFIARSVTSGVSIDIGTLTGQPWLCIGNNSSSGNEYAITQIWLEKYT